MKIGVIGMGVVGSAVHKGFQHCDDVVLKAFDINGKHDAVTELFDCDLIFGCTPTPTLANNKQDQSSLIVTAKLLHASGFKGVFVVKSTVVPGTCDKVAEKFSGLRIVHNPEFLTAANPYEDFMKQDQILLSGDLADVEVAKEAYQKSLPKASFMLSTDRRSTELAKYLHNTFLATKVAFFNEFYDLCQELGTDFQCIRSMALAQGVVGESHTRVPGPDGQRGYGGMCFPKDTKALAKVHPKLSILRAAIAANKKVREEE